MRRPKKNQKFTAIIAIDGGEVSGYAAWLSGRLDPKPHGYGTPQQLGRVGWLAPAAALWVIEAYTHGNCRAAQANGLNTADAMYALGFKRNAAYVVTVGHTTWAKGLGCPRGRDEGKKWSIKRARKLGYDVTDHNEADAINLLEYAKKKWLKDG